MNRLSEKAMLVRLSISQWTARKYDKKISGEVTAQYQTNSDSGRWNKVLIAQDAIKAIAKSAGNARTFHYDNTLPWGDDESRLLPSANYLTYSQKISELKTEFEKAVREFSANYPALIDDARISLNGMFNPMDYPNPDDIERKYRLSVSVNPLPDAADFRVTLHDSDVDAIRQDIETRAQDAQKEATRDLWERLHSVVASMVERLSDPKAIFRDSLVSNINDLTALLPRLNVTDDPGLEAMRRAVEARLGGYEPEKLRENKYVRQEAAKEAQDILNTMSGYMGGV
jgi:hypothetical protein